MDLKPGYLLLNIMIPGGMSQSLNLKGNSSKLITINHKLEIW